MTEREKRFADHYIVSLNASEACLQVSPNCKNPNVYGHQLLSKPEVKQYVEDKIAKISKKLELKAEDVIEEIRTVAFAKITDFMDYDDAGMKLKDSKEVDATAVNEVTFTTDEKGKVTKRIKLHDKLKALEILARYFKLLTDSKEKAENVTILDVLDYLKNKELERKEYESKKLQV